MDIKKTAIYIPMDVYTQAQGRQKEVNCKTFTDYVYTLIRKDIKSKVIK